MVSDNARGLKTRWMKVPVRFFEYLTFGELEAGQKFICLPEPGDNNGHGGLKGAHFIFTKTDHEVDRISVGIAKDNSGMERNFSHSLAVILIE